jgi:hypothetical protein
MGGGAFLAFTSNLIIIFGFMSTNGMLNMRLTHRANPETHMYFEWVLMILAFVSSMKSNMVSRMFSMSSAFGTAKWIGVVGMTR